MGRDEEKLKEQVFQDILQDAWTPNRKESVFEKRDAVILNEQISGG
jgi:hypothetical protein